MKFFLKVLIYYAQIINYSMLNLTVFSFGNLKSNSTQNENYGIISHQTLLVPIDFHHISKPMGTKTVWLPTFFKISSFMFFSRK